MELLRKVQAAEDHNTLTALVAEYPQSVSCRITVSNAIQPIVWMNYARFKHQSGQSSPEAIRAMLQTQAAQLRSLGTVLKHRRSNCFQNCG